jgi:uncharacterized protein YcaQ
MLASLRIRSRHDHHPPIHAPIPRKHLVGKLDATADRKAGALRIHALHWDAGPSKTMAAAVDREVHDLANWLELNLAPAA